MRRILFTSLLVVALAFALAAPASASRLTFTAEPTSTRECGKNETCPIPAPDCEPNQTCPNDDCGHQAMTCPKTGYVMAAPDGGEFPTPK